MIDRVPLGALWEETAAFFRAELPLVAPVAFLGFGVPMVAMLLAVPVEQAQAGVMTPGLWMLWFVPAGLMSMFGSLAVSALALRRGETVRACLALALTRVPSGIGLALLNVAVQAALAIPVAMMRIADGGQGVGTALANLTVFAMLIWLFVRVLPIWALLADRPLGPVAAIRATFAATRGRYRVLLLLRVAGALAGVIALVVLLIPIGVVFKLVGLAVGVPEVGTTLSYVASAAAFAMIASLWTIYCARLYRLLAGSTSGI